ncbi:hypothetical protein SBV42_03750 [Chlamydia crocodili]|uniref:Macro domain-containing protein n=1 Tax=Chlamydia crocodili TaxID=2766982 RepID=A0ABX8CD89_9CHLA|nr:hypothetical protein [Chlamydia crocodili]QVE48877.1 hypothetical protein H9Q19_04120 [Chlamydia crocodili]
MSTSPINNQSLCSVNPTATTYIHLGNIKLPLIQIIQTISALGMALNLGGVITLALGSSLAIALPLLIIGFALLILSCFILLTCLKKPHVAPIPSVETEYITPPISPVVKKPPIPIETPKTTPVATPTQHPIEIFIPEPETPNFLDFTPEYTAHLLQTRFELTGIYPAGRMNKNTEYVTIRSKNTDLNVCFLKGHPLDDPFLKKTNSAILVLTNADRQLHLLVGRSLTLMGQIEEKCWNKITKPHSKKFPPRTIVSGSWVNVLGAPPASHLICANPPDILLTNEVDNRLITFTDFNCEIEFQAAVRMYQAIFRICRENEITSVQIELVGLNNIGSHQEEYEAWHSGCCLALLEAIRLEEENKFRTLIHITVNSLSELPLSLSLQQAYQPETLFGMLTKWLSFSN